LTLSAENKEHAIACGKESDISVLGFLNESWPSEFFKCGKKYIITNTAIFRSSFYFKKKRVWVLHEKLFYAAEVPHCVSHKSRTSYWYRNGTIPLLCYRRNCKKILKRYIEAKCLRWKRD
jgi:hypothetical protein